MAMLGLVYLILLFLACFAFVHIIKLAAIGFMSLRRKPEVKEEKKPEKTPKPVYYIVEKKRSKKNYSQPREIEFK
jgi:flagellar basal body-associated protein FliL